MRAFLIVMILSSTLTACGDERNIKYHVSATGISGLQIEYQTADGLVYESAPKLPWNKWVKLQTGSKAYFLATCRSEGGTNIFSDDEDKNATGCSMKAGSISNSDSILTESLPPIFGSAPKIELEYEVDY
jgi:hypothetical protein